MTPEERRAYQREWARANPDKMRAARRRYRAKHPDPNASSRRWYARNRRHRASWGLQKLYGITADQRDEMFAAQGGVCAVCGTAEKRDRRGFVVDHHHDSGKVRGILCNPCNLALGNARESPETLEAMAAYLRRHAA